LRLNECLSLFLYRPSPETSGYTLVYQRFSVLFRPMQLEALQWAAPPPNEFCVGS